MAKSPTHFIDPAPFSLDDVALLLSDGNRLALSELSEQAVRRCRRYLEEKLAQSDEPIYGVNTGFGSLCNIRIPDTDIERLQHNLVVSHAAGTGDLAPPEIARIMLLLKIKSLSQGYSGVRTEVIERLIDLFNAGITPLVYELGSLGASGDLAPLAHLSLPLIGLGEVWYEGRRQRADVAMQILEWAPLVFQAKEAIALLNGTQFSSAYAVWCLLKARRLMEQADLNAAAAFDAFDCRLSPLDEHIHRIRPHQGQLTAARKMRDWLKNSEISAQNKQSVQDPYAFRCAPQVHGATRDALDYIEKTILTEINAVTDNPNVFPDDDLILSGGNFHAQPVALAMDHFALAVAELGSISERRTFQLLSGQRGLPAFLAPDPGLHSGMMIAQYTAAAIVSQNKSWCMPASADSIVSSNGQEDHVSMAANAAVKARHIAINVGRVLAIEWMCIAQAIECRRPLRSSPTIEALLADYRQVVPRLEADRILQIDIDRTMAWMETM